MGWLWSLCRGGGLMYGGGLIYMHLSAIMSLFVAGSRKVFCWEGAAKIF